MDLATNRSHEMTPGVSGQQYFCNAEMNFPSSGRLNILLYKRQLSINGKTLYIIMCDGKY